MLNKVVPNIVNESLDWFFTTVLKDHYDKRRQTLSEPNGGAIPAIDYILKTHIGKEASYPPESASQWNKYYVNLESTVFKQILLIYLKLDVNDYLSHKDCLTKSRTKDKSELAALENALNKLLTLPLAFDFTNSVTQLSTGLWAVDNEDTNLIVSSLSNPTINLANYFESPKELNNIIVDSLIINQQPRMALFMSKVHRYENWDDSFNAIYAFLLISSGQLIEALKYERMFLDRENYHDILQRFFELCSEYNVTKSLNCLNLSIDEEEVLNEHLVSESRPVTPASSQTTQTRHHTSSPSSATKQKSRNRNIQVVRRVPSFNDSPARNTRSARKRKPVK